MKPGNLFAFSILIFLHFSCKTRAHSHINSYYSINYLICESNVNSNRTVSDKLDTIYTSITNSKGFAKVYMETDSMSKIKKLVIFDYLNVNIKYRDTFSFYGYYSSESKKTDKSIHSLYSRLKFGEIKLTSSCDNDSLNSAYSKYFLILW